MFEWLERRKRARRAAEYARHLPGDEPAIKAILLARELLGTEASARDAAEMLVGRKLTADEWAKVHVSFETAWKYIVG